MTDIVKTLCSPDGNDRNRVTLLFLLVSPARTAGDTFSLFYLMGMPGVGAVSTDGTNFAAPQKASSVGQQPQYEMFGNRDIPFLGDYNWIQLVDLGDGSLFGYLSWPDNRDVVSGTDPRESVQDGFDVHQCRVLQSDGTYGPDTCPNAGGLDQNIYRNSITIP
jgi:hypothetical protein